MIRTIYSRTNIFLQFVIFITFISSLILTICKCIKKAIITFAFATILLILFLEEYYNKHKFFTKKKSIKKPSKITNQQSHGQSSPTTSQENPTPPTTTQNPQTSTRISFQDNPYTFEERHARLSEPLEPVQ